MEYKTVVYISALLLVSTFNICAGTNKSTKHKPFRRNVHAKAPLRRLNDGHEMPTLALGTWIGSGIEKVRAKAPLRRLNDGHEMPTLALGTWLGSGIEKCPKKPTDNNVKSAVEWAIDAGYRHIDTAAICDTEPQVREAVDKKISDGVVARADMFITTKLWNDRHAKNWVVPALRESLKRLNLEYVDLYLIHWPVAFKGQPVVNFFKDETFMRSRSKTEEKEHENAEIITTKEIKPNTTFDSTDYLETWRGMVEARDLGLTRSVGVSNFNEQQLQRLLDNSNVKPAALQVEINLNLQQPSLLALCKKHDIAVIGYAPFGSLFPNKAAATAPPPRVSEPALVNIARKYNKTVPQIALRYLTELGVVPLPQSITKSRVEQNIDIFDMSLTSEEKEQLRSYDKNYRTIEPLMWKKLPYYPF